MCDHCVLRVMQYARYRIGSCLFIINSEPSNISLASSEVIAKSEQFHHPIAFDTTPGQRGEVEWLHIQTGTFTK